MHFGVFCKCDELRVLARPVSFWGERCLANNHRVDGDDFHWIAGFQGGGIVLSRMAVVFSGLVPVNLLSNRNTDYLYSLICRPPFLG